MPERAVTSFAARVAAAVAETGPLCCGLDPSADLLEAWGLPDDAGGLRAFSHTCLEAFAGAVGVVKPQVAFYERHGSAGFAALEDLLASARQAGLVAIADAKRGDISTTAEAYAAAWLDDLSPLAADAVTAVAYLGLGALAPLEEAAVASGRGVIVVARSSNPDGRRLQDSGLVGGGSVADRLLAEIAEHNAGGANGALGAVVGATLAPSAFDLSTLGGVLLAPGVGAQGGSATAAAKLFAGCPAGSVLPSASRSVLEAGPSVAALREAALSTRDELGEALG